MAVNRENREYDARVLLSDVEQPARDGTWPLEKGAMGGCQRDSGPVRWLLLVVRGDHKVPRPVRHMEQAVKSESTILSGHWLIWRELGKGRTASILCVSVRIFFGGSAAWSPQHHKPRCICVSEIIQLKKCRIAKLLHQLSWTHQARGGATSHSPKHPQAALF